MTPSRVLWLFLLLREKVASVHPRVQGATLTLVPGVCPEGGKRCSPRDYAFAQGLEIHLSVKALKLPRANVEGLLLHELGHVADPTPDEPGAEQRADDIAEKTNGKRISYDTRDVQTVAEGKWPRPKHLHQ